MAWVYLIAAGGLEVAATTVYRVSGGLTRFGPVVLLLLLGAASFYCLHRSVSGEGAIPIGTAYAVWTGIGAAGTAVLGVLFYGEPGSALRLALLFLLVASIVGLKMVGGH